MAFTFSPASSRIVPFFHLSIFSVLSVFSMLLNAGCITLDGATGAAGGAGAAAGVIAEVGAGCASSMMGPNAMDEMNVPRSICMDLLISNLEARGSHLETTVA